MRVTSAISFFVFVSYRPDRSLLSPSLLLSLSLRKSKSNRIKTLSSVCLCVCIFWTQNIARILRHPFFLRSPDASSFRRGVSSLLRFVFVSCVVVVLFAALSRRIQKQRERKVFTFTSFLGAQTLSLSLSFRERGEEPVLSFLSLARDENGGCFGGGGGEGVRARAFLWFGTKRQSLNFSGFRVSFFDFDALPLNTTKTFPKKQGRKVTRFSSLSLSLFNREIRAFPFLSLSLSLSLSLFEDNLSRARSRRFVLLLLPLLESFANSFFLDLWRIKENFCVLSGDLSLSHSLSHSLSLSLSLSRWDIRSLSR